MRSIATPGFTVWLTGFSGAGKSTIGRLLADELERRGHLVELLDGDVTRRHLSPDLGYTREDRDLHIARLGWLASRLTRQGAAVVVAAISPYEAARASARRAVEEHGTFVEVWVRATIEECARRDVKGLYARALAGEIVSFTGVSDPYESPRRPDLLLDTELQSPTASLALVITDLERRSLVSPLDLSQGLDT